MRALPGAACSTGRRTLWNCCSEFPGLAGTSDRGREWLDVDCGVWATETRCSGDLRTCKSELSQLPTKWSVGPRQGREGGQSASGLQSTPSHFLKIAAPGSSSPLYYYSSPASMSSISALMIFPTNWTFTPSLPKILVSIPHTVIP